jgi:hypothetical protein
MFLFIIIITIIISKHHYLPIPSTSKKDRQTLDDIMDGRISFKNSNEKALLSNLSKSECCDGDSESSSESLQQKKQKNETKFKFINSHYLRRNEGEVYLFLFILIVEL